MYIKLILIKKIMKYSSLYHYFNKNIILFLIQTKTLSVYNQYIFPVINIIVKIT